MTCTITMLVADVLALMGETAATSAEAAAIFPGADPREAVSRKVAALLPGAGSTLIADADVKDLADAPLLTLTASKRLMPSGAYAGVATLPAGFLRAVAVRMECWADDARHIFGAGCHLTPRLWNPEPGIAGTPTAPLAYILAGSEGLQIWGMASPSDSTESLLLRCWSIPTPDAEGTFHFPGALYAALAARIASQMM
ncbi:MAG: hypothetical protein K2K93_03110 [Muribaculaceae bacterium]|nr:hypothetical protein [Muribaculaceae bacterium]